jgi:sugar lactone lactonase YvrE
MYPVPTDITTEVYTRLPDRFRIVDPETGAVTPLLDRAFTEGFRGVNDLHFARNGDIYFTDQGQSGLQDPSGRVYKLTPPAGWFA